METEAKGAGVTTPSHKPTLPDIKNDPYYYASILDSVPDAIITTDMELAILSWNRAAEAIYGWTAGEVIGKPINSVVPTDYVDITPEEFLEQFTMHGSWKGDVIQQRKDKRYIHVISSVSWLTDSAGHKVGAIAVNRDITERKRSEEATRLSEARYRSLIQTQSDVISRSDLSGNLTFVNDSYCRVAGKSREELLGKPFTLRVLPEDLPITLDMLEAIKVPPYRKQIETRQITQAGIRWFSWDNSAVIDEKGNVIEFQGVGRDITGLVRTQKAVEESREFLQSTLNGLSAHIAILDETGTIMAVNEAWRRFADANDLNDPAYGVGTNYLALCDEAAGSYADEAPFVAAGIRNLLARDGNGFYLEYPCHSPMERRWFMMRLDSFRVGGDRRVVIAHYDITERKLAEEKEHQQRVMADALADVAATINNTLDLDEVLEHIVGKIGQVVPHSGANLMFVDAEKEIARIVRYCGCYARHGLPEPQLGKIITFAEIPGLKVAVEQAQSFAIPNVNHYPDWVVWPGNEWIRSYACAPIRVDGKVIGFINVDSDTPEAFAVTHAHQLRALADQAAVAIRNAQLYQELENYSAFLEQAVAERTAELQESEARYRGIIEDQTEMICRMLPDGTTTFANEAYCRYFDKPPEELMGYNFRPLVFEEDRPELDQRFASLGPQNPIMTVEHRVIAADGEIRWMEWTDRMLFDAQGNSYQIQAVGRDVTERKKAEEQLSRTLARETEVNLLKSRYMSMAAHDLRNPLAAIQTTVDVIQNYPHRLTEEQKQAKFNTIHRSIKVMVDLLNDTLTLGLAESGKLRFEPKLLDLVAFCQDLVAELQQTTAIVRQISFSHQGVCGTVSMDARLLRHILGNLLSNAIKYSPADTTVIFDMHCGSSAITFHIQDQGIGIPQADQTRLFEAFQRAKNVGSIPGTGLGLAIVKQSVDLHGGTITYESKEGQGTTFTIVLPQ